MSREKTSMALERPSLLEVKEFKFINESSLDAVYFTEATVRVNAIACIIVAKEIEFQWNF